MKKIMFFMISAMLAATAFGAKLDINIIYESSAMHVKETVCGWQPDIEKGYIAAEDDCYQARYQLDVPMYGFKFEPISGPVQQETKVAYYISFFDSAVPKDDHVKTEVTKNGTPERVVKGIKHDRTFEGLVILKPGENLVFTSKPEPSYFYIYIIATVFIAIGMFFIVRKKK